MPEKKSFGPVVWLLARDGHLLSVTIFRGVQIFSGRSTVIKSWSAAIFGELDLIIAVIMSPNVLALIAIVKTKTNQ